MSYIPNIREEGPYNEKNLQGENRAYIQGFDAAVQTVDGFFDNLDIYSSENLVVHYLQEHEEAAEQVKKALLDYLEMERNEAGVSLIDAQPDEDA